MDSENVCLLGVDRKWSNRGQTDAIDPHVWSGRALQEVFVDLAQFLCSCLAAVPSSRPAGAEMRRAQGLSRLAVALALPLAPALPGHALTGPKHGARIKRVGRLHR